MTTSNSGNTFEKKPSQKKRSHAIDHPATALDETTTATSSSVETHAAVVSVTNSFSNAAAAPPPPLHHETSLGDITASNSASSLNYQQYPAVATSSSPPAMAPPPSSTLFPDENNKSEHQQQPKDQHLMSAEDKRRYERNLREQQRSYKISQQIKELRTVLAESHIPFKPNKFSILLSVVEYIKQLQQRSIVLDNEHKKLIMTIQQTKEMVERGEVVGSGENCVVGGNGTNVALPTVGGNLSYTHNSQSNSSSSNNKNGGVGVGNDANMLFVQGLEYKNIFAQCPAALGIAALDGRFIACNAEFESVSGYTFEELRVQSLFNLLTHRDMEEVFQAMGEMLKNASTSSSSSSCNGVGGAVKQSSHGGDGSDIHRQKGVNDAFLEEKADGEGGEEKSWMTYWSGIVSQKHQHADLRMNITLARTAEGMPKFFNCALTNT
mmetsp:Transcript_7438/g.9911  ORF Transcript_7438/g.9911 Transcript_7438/m.9911 type:complete len:437 (+) Transcript_7438:285-1595(+)